MLATITPQHKPGSSLDHFNSKKIETDYVTGLPSVVPCDTIDNPILKKLLLERDTAEENIFLEMKHESNRLYSFRNRWPVTEITPESLADAGFFYLQQEDRVQCPFCYVIIYNWTHGDTPLREHMKKSPKCPFLVGSNVGNVPILAEKPKQSSLTLVVGTKQSSHSVTAAYKPNHPRMADIKRRILTFSSWPLKKPGPQDLAECGLYYSGTSDFVTCFFCGGGLGNWELEDDPWTEHSKYYPDCSFLAIIKNRPKSAKIPAVPDRKLVAQKNPIDGMPVSSLASCIIEQALDIFPERLVLDAVKRKHGTISSLQELCDDILELEQPSHHEINVAVLEETNCTSENSPAIKDAVLCKLCMDRERGAVFQPCGHLVSCWKCSNLISDCPVCRSPIIHRIRTYLS